MPKIIADEELKTLIADTKKQKIYDEEVRPLLDQLKVMCTRYGFPFFVTICIDPQAQVKYKKTDRKVCVPDAEPKYESAYKHTLVSPYAAYKDPDTLNPDYIAECIKIINGYKATLPLKDIDVITDDDEF